MKSLHTLAGLTPRTGTEQHVIAHMVRLVDSIVSKKPSPHNATHHIYNAFCLMQTALTITPEFQSDLNIRVAMSSAFSEASERCVPIRVVPKVVSPVRRSDARAEFLMVD